MLFLNNKDIHRAVSFNDLIESMKSAILAHHYEEVKNPERSHIDFGKNTLLTMPCIGKHHFSTKLVTVFPDNHLQQLPSIFGTLILNDSDTGKPLAILDAKAVTALRTGAVGGLSVLCLVPKKIKKIGIVGTGVQGLYQALFACSIRKCVDEVIIFNRSKEKINIFTEKFQQYFPTIQVHNVQNINELLRVSELVITATTSPKPVLPNDKNLLKGKHFLAVGSYRPNMQELPDAISQLVDKVYVDTLHAKLESGDLVIPLRKGYLQEKQINTLVSFLEKNIMLQDPQENTTLFKSVGSAVFDLFAAELIYKNALAQNIGQSIKW